MGGLGQPEWTAGMGPEQLTIFLLEGMGPAEESAPPVLPASAKEELRQLVARLLLHHLEKPLQPRG